jgi:hypothetical protein
MSLLLLTLFLFLPFLVAVAVAVAIAVAVAVVVSFINSVVAVVIITFDDVSLSRRRLFGRRVGALHRRKQTIGGGVVAAVAAVAVAVAVDDGVVASSIFPLVVVSRGR